jgi:hypothetical protein
MNFKAVYGETVFQSVYESAMKEPEKSHREDNSSYELADPVAGLQPTKKAVAMDRTDNRTEYLYPDGTNITDWYGP